MKKLLVLLLTAILLLSLCACTGTAFPTEGAVPAETQVTEPPAEPTQAPAATESVPVSEESVADPAEKPETTTPKTNILVVYFSRTGEQYNVGVIDEGNTAIVAKAIAAETGADVFEILPATDYYPYTYAELTDVAKKEQNENARPAIRDALPDLSQYDTVFIGAPVWWGDWPMIVYSFCEAADLSGKTLIPFCTHEGSGLSGCDRKLASACPDSTVLDGFAIRGSDCQNDRSNVESKVQSWLDELGY